MPSPFSFSSFSFESIKIKQTKDRYRVHGPRGRSRGSRHSVRGGRGERGGAPRPPSRSLFNGIALSIFSPPPPPQRGRKRTDAVCVVGRPSKRLKRGRNKTDRWREEGEGEGGGGGVPRPLILAHFHRDWVTRTVPTHTRTHSARHQGFPAIWIYRYTCGTAIVLPSAHWSTH